MPDIHKHAAASQKVCTDDLNWELAAEVGLSEREERILPYFADIEGQTIFYMMELLKLPVARDPNTIAFATIWNYEEYYHSQAFNRLLEVCGVPLADDRVTAVRGSVKLRARLEDFAQVLLARICPESFSTLWMMWGASQEALTMRGYEQIAATTRNPVLAELCRRIAKQERRHFAWYFNAAKERLAGEEFAQKLCRWVFERAWTPVGEGVKSAAEVAALVSDLFPNGALVGVASDIDERFAALPGMAGFDVVSRYARAIPALIGAGGAEPRPVPTPA